jgi:opacity protein-like surface antigen
MNLKLSLLSILLFVAAGCASPAQDKYVPGQPYKPPGTITNMRRGQTLAQGMIGTSVYDDIERSGGDSPPTEDQTDSLEQAFTLGGVFQHAIWGDKVDAGLEVGGTLGFRTGGGFVYAGGGGLVVAVDIDMYIFELFGGPFVSMPLGDKLRVYGGAGPLLQFSSWGQTGDGVDESGTGFGSGLYARTGLEFLLSRNMLLGFGVRWSDSRTSLGGGLGDVDLQSTQGLVTITSSI